MTDAQQDPWTVLRLLEWTTGFFQKKGSPSARLDAEVLLAHARECSRIELYMAFGEVPTEEQLVAFREMVRHRGEGMPVAQLVGFKEFYSMKFRVNEHVLIPRPETEHVVIEALDRAKALAGAKQPLQVADLGTGTGAIAIAIAKHLPNARVTAVDVSTEALNIAAWNADQHSVGDQVSFVESDLLKEVTAPETFDIICSNPPYVSEGEYEELSATVRDFEPRDALVSGFTGTEIIDRLLEEAPGRMTAGGRLIIELSPMIAEQCEELAETTGVFADLKFIKDLAGHRRVLSLRYEG